MKIKYSLIVAATLAIAACEHKLDLAPQSNLTDGTFYRTAGDAEAAVGACYAHLTANVYGTDGLMFIDLATTDDAVPFLTGVADRPALWRYDINPSNTFINVWGNGFSGINKSNTVIARIAGIEMEESLKKRYIAEVKFLRALNYFNLVRLYGGLPLVTKESTSLTGLDVPKADESEIYALIEEDLLEAEQVLPVSYPASETGRATKGAVKALLAKVYLTRAGSDSSSPYWSKAAAKSKEVIDQGIYGLWEDFGEVFSLANRGGKESVFEVQYITDVRGNGYGGAYGIRSAPIYPGGGAGIARVSEGLFNAYSEEDKRKPVTLITSYTHNDITVDLSISDPDPTKGIYFQKLWDRTSKLSGGNGTSFPVIRFSDVLLMYAEALNEQRGNPDQEAYEALNRVRVRAGLEPLADLDYTAFREAVWKERRLELAFELHRRFDLVRTGRLIDAVRNENGFSRNASIQPFHLLLPIPFREMEATTNLVQNEGY